MDTIFLCISYIAHSVVLHIFNFLSTGVRCLVARPARGGAGGGQNTWGPDWFGGPEILIKHLVIALLSRGLGARNA